MENNHWAGEMLKRAKRRKHHPLIFKAIDYCGSQTLLAKAAGLSTPQISRLLWLERRVTGEVAVAIEKATNGTISRRQLCPHLFK